MAEDIEIDAELFKLIRANQDMTRKALLKLIKEHFPTLTQDQLNNSLIRLARRVNEA